MVRHFARMGKQLKSDYDGFLEKTTRVIQKAMTRESLTRVAVTLGVLGGAVGADQLAGGHVAAWSVDFAAQFWQDHMQAYSTPGIGGQTMRAVGLMLLAPYLYETTGYLGGLVTGMGSKAAFLSKVSFQVYSLMAGYFQAASWLMGIKNALPAARRGINPLRALSLPFASNERQAQARRDLEKNVLKDLRLDNAAWLLAHSDLIDKEGLDPVALAEAEVAWAKDRASVEGVLEKRAALADSAQDTRERATSAIGIRQAVKDLGAEDFVGTLKTLPQDKLLALIETANAFRTKLKASSRLTKAVRQLSGKTQMFFQRKLPRGFGVFASESFRDLSAAESNESLMNQNFRVFRYAFTAELLLSSVMGSYADVSHPEGLLANGQGPFGINPGFLAQQMQSILFIVLANPARMFLDFALVKEPSSAAPTPDQLIYPMQERRAGYFQSAGKWAWNTLNPVKMNMGYYALRHFRKSWLMIMPALTMAVAVRMGLLGQDFDQAAVGELFRTITAYLAYGWLWGLETRSLTYMEQETMKVGSASRDAQMIINQGLRENNREMVADGVNRLIGDYMQGGKDLPEGARSISHANLMQVADILLKANMEKSIRPDRPNELFMLTVTICMAIFGNHLSTNFFHLAYASGQSLEMMLQTLLGGVEMAAVGYSLIWAGQTGINQLHQMLVDVQAARKAGSTRSLLQDCQSWLLARDPHKGSL